MHTCFTLASLRMCDMFMWKAKYIPAFIIYPEALCTQAWTQMNLMAIFNEDIFTAVGHDGFTDI